MPVLDIELPLFAFYWIAPALFVLFHFNLLTQLCLLAEKLRELDNGIEELPDDVRPKHRASLHLFIFSHALIGHHHDRLIRSLLTLTVWTTFAILPVLILLLAQIKFSPYHSVPTTWWHRGLVVLSTPVEN